MNVPPQSVPKSNSVPAVSSLLETEIFPVVRLMHPCMVFPLRDASNVDELDEAFASAMMRTSVSFAPLSSTNLYVNIEPLFALVTEAEVADRRCSRSC